MYSAAGLNSSRPERAIVERAAAGEVALAKVARNPHMLRETLPTSGRPGTGLGERVGLQSL